MTSKSKSASLLANTPSPVRASWLSAAIILAPLALLGEVLIVSTHHRPLGAATFATLAVILWAGSEVISRRLLNPRDGIGRARARRAVWVLSIAACVFVVARALL